MEPFGGRKGEFIVINYGGSHPLAPEVYANLVSPVTGAASSRVRCIIDTGASMTCIPLNVIKELGPGLDYRALRVASVAGDSRGVVYIVHLQLARCNFGDLEVLSVDLPFGLIGRDILNRYRLLLDGVGQSWRIEGNADC